MLFHLPTLITIFIDILAWFVIHMGISYLMAQKPRYDFPSRRLALPAAQLGTQW